MNAAVVDAGPLIHLAEISRLPLLNIFETIHIPDKVWFESVQQGRVQKTATAALRNIERHTLDQSLVDPFIREKGLENLQSGEVECFYLSQQIGVATLVTDDLAVREAAKRLELVPVGSLGIVVRAHSIGRISLDDAERHIAQLYDISSLFVTRTVAELAIEELQKLSR